MGRSPWLRVYARVLSIALVTGLAFAAAPLQSSLASHPSSNSPDHNAKGTQSVVTPGEPKVQPPTACGHVVSGPLSLPAQGCFSPVPHGTRPLSVTRESFALEGGPPSFTPDYSSRALLRNSTSTIPSPSPTGLSPSLAPRSRGLRLASIAPCCGSYNPGPRERAGLGMIPVRSPLLGDSQLIPRPPGTEMFQFPGFARSKERDAGRPAPGCPIRPSRDQCVCAAPPSLSQLTAAFLASVCPGILHAPSLA